MTAPVGEESDLEGLKEVVEDLAADLVPRLLAVVEAHVRGTRYGIGVDRADALLSQGADGLALGGVQDTEHESGQIGRASGRERVSAEV